MPSGATWGKRPVTKETESTPSLDAFVKGTGPEMTSRFHCILPAELHKRVKAACATEGTTMTDVVVELLETRFPKKG